MAIKNVKAVLFFSKLLIVFSFKHSSMRLESRVICKLYIKNLFNSLKCNLPY